MPRCIVDVAAEYIFPSLLIPAELYQFPPSQTIPFSIVDDIGNVTICGDVDTTAIPHCLIANDYGINAGFLLVLFLNN